MRAMAGELKRTKRRRTGKKAGSPDIPGALKKGDVLTTRYHSSAIIQQNINKEFCNKNTIENNV